MAVTLTSDVYQDELAMTMARIMAVANQRAKELGVDAQQSLISITQRPDADGVLWRVSYGPRDYIGRRGGDLIIDIEPSNASIQQVLRGQ